MQPYAGLSAVCAGTGSDAAVELFCRSPIRAWKDTSWVVPFRI
jgi:hypothetical protein